MRCYFGGLLGCNGIITVGTCSNLWHSMVRIREAASKTQEAPQEAPSKILNKELAKDLPAEFRGYWPKEPTVKRSIHSQRRKFIPELPKSLKDLTIPEAW